MAFLEIKKKAIHSSGAMKILKKVLKVVLELR